MTTMTTVLFVGEHLLEKPPFAEPSAVAKLPARPPSSVGPSSVRQTMTERPMFLNR